MSPVYTARFCLHVACRISFVASCKRTLNVQCRAEKKVAPFQAQAVPCPKRYSVNEVLVLYNIFAILRERLLFRAVISTEEK